VPVDQNKLQYEWRLAWQCVCVAECEGRSWLRRWCKIRRNLGSNTQEAHHSLRVPHRAQRALCTQLRQKQKVTERKLGVSGKSFKDATSKGTREGGGGEERQEKEGTIISA
jgi:hypothetical protein